MKCKFVLSLGTGKTAQTEVEKIPKLSGRMLNLTNLPSNIDAAKDLAKKLKDQVTFHCTCTKFRDKVKFHLFRLLHPMGERSKRLEMHFNL